MTVETIDGSGDPITKSGPYNGNGATSVFDYDFQIQAQTELVVVRQNADLTEDTLTLTTDYTVAGVGVDGGGQITLAAPATSLPTGAKLIIKYDGDYNQSADYSSQGGVNLAELEAALDKITMHLRGLKELADRSVKVDAFGTEDLTSLQADLRSLAAIETAISTVAAISADVSAVAAIDANVTTVAGIAANVTAVAGIVADVSAVAAIDTDVSAVALVDAAVAAVALITADVSAVAAIDADVAALAAITADITNLAAIDADVTRVADIYQGALAADPTTRLDGSALAVGDFYLDTSTGNLTFLQSTGPAVWVGVGALAKATQVQAEAGTDNTAYMTPLRTAQAIAERGLTFSASMATTSGTAFDFASIPADVKEIFVLLSGVSLSGTDAALEIQVGPSGGLVTSGYLGAGYVSAPGIGSFITNNSSGFLIRSGGAASRAVTGVFHLIRDGATNKWFLSGVGMDAAEGLMVTSAGEVTLGGALAQLRLTRTGTDTFDAGAVRIGYR